MKTQTVRFLLLITLIFSLLTSTMIAHAATFTVTNLNDSGAGSLREAITGANVFASADTITFSVSGTITLVSTLPPITDAMGLMLDGTGQTVTISANDTFPVLSVNTGASLTLNNLTVTNGRPGISSSGTVTIMNSNISGNSTVGGNGGGISNTGTATITNSTFSGNTAAGGNGGGIYNSGTATITNSTFSGNSAAGGFGGGINTSGTLTITNSTFSGNGTPGGFGGGIYSSGTSYITNSTFSGNTAAGGSGASIYTNGGTVTLRNTILATGALVGNCGGVAVTNGGNNIDSGTSCAWGAVSGSMSSTNPLLGALADNGGPTQTFALLPGSPAINGVVFNAPNGAPSTDQRGFARLPGTLYDIGSYEAGYRVHLPVVVR